MKLLLTRIGFNSKFFISGDLDQFDRHKNKTDTGLWDVLSRFQHFESIGVHEFGDNDIVRNPIITRILKRYEQ
jgi:phosphate starvation-inducible PhoH-like protein